MSRESWPTQRLKYAATINDDALGEDVHPDYELRYLDIGNVGSDGTVSGATTYRFADAPSRARRQVQDGDVIVSTVRTYLQAIAPITDPPDNLIVSTGFAVVRPRPDVLLAGFCKYALREPAFLAEVERRSVGISYPAINASDLGDIAIPLPPLNEQRAVADDLDRETARLDALVAAKERLLGLLAEKRRALVTRAVTRGLDEGVAMRDSGVPWLGEVPARWATTRLRRLARSIEQGWSPEAEAREPDEGEWGVIKLSAVRDGRFDSSAAKALPADVAPIPSLEIRRGDFLVTRANTPALVGDSCFVAHVRPHLMLCDLVYRLRLDEDAVNGQYLGSFLTLPIGRAQIEADARGTSNSMVKISQEHIKNWWVPLPPLEEQRAIVAHIAAETAELDALRAATERTLALLRERRAALITAAVSSRAE